MSNDTKKGVANVLRSPVVRALFPLGALVAETVDFFSASAGRIDQSKTEDEVSRALAREEGKARIAEALARVQQEMAIAGRIATADEVEIEEFYEGSVEGNVSVKIDGQMPAVGAGVGNRKVTRRVIRFKGWNVEAAAEAPSVQVVKEGPDKDRT